MQAEADAKLKAEADAMLKSEAEAKLKAEAVAIAAAAEAAATRERAAAAATAAPPYDETDDEQDDDDELPTPVKPPAAKSVVTAVAAAPATAVRDAPRSSHRGIGSVYGGLLDSPSTPPSSSQRLQGPLHQQHGVVPPPGAGASAATADGRDSSSPSSSLGDGVRVSLEDTYDDEDVEDNAAGSGGPSPAGRSPGGGRPWGTTTVTTAPAAAYGSGSVVVDPNGPHAGAVLNDSDADDDDEEEEEGNAPDDIVAHDAGRRGDDEGDKEGYEEDEEPFNVARSHAAQVQALHGRAGRSHRAPEQAEYDDEAQAVTDDDESDANVPPYDGVDGGFHPEVQGPENDMIAQLAAAHGVPDEDIQQFTLALLNGIVFRKHGRRGWPHERVVWIDAFGDELLLRWGKVDSREKSESVSLGAMRGVGVGRCTDVLRRSASKRADPLVFAIHLDDGHSQPRTLDLEASSPEERDFYASQFQRIIEDLTLFQAALVFAVQTGQWVHPAPRNVDAQADYDAPDGAGEEV